MCIAQTTPGVNPNGGCSQGKIGPSVRSDQSMQSTPLSPDIDISENVCPDRRVRRIKAPGEPIARGCHSLTTLLGVSSTENDDRGLTEVGVKFVPGGLVVER